MSLRLTKVVVFALVGVGAIVWLAIDQRRVADLQRISKSGTATQGRVTSMDQRRGGQFLTVSYRYFVDNQPREARDRRVGDFNGLTGGGPVTVWFDPQAPERCVIANELSDLRFGWTPYLFGIVIAGMMGFAGFQAWRRAGLDRDPEL